jgi:hypothetical protein
MARKKSPKPEEETSTSFMFPSLHDEVETAVSDDIPSIWFHENDSDKKSNKRYSTYVMARFKCDNNACSKKAWTSGKVTILITGYPKNGYNAVVFNQRCKGCDQLGNLIMDEESYVDRVAYRLKKWAGVAVEQPIYTRKETPPHRSDLCEGCKRYVCGR